MTRIQKAFYEKKDRTYLIPYLTAGLPDKKTCLSLALLLEELGVKILELGIPFSDPVLDGIVLQRASSLALSNGVNTEAVLSLIERIREKTKGLAIVLMSYLNPIYAYGIRRFFRDARNAGADGILIPDCPLEEVAIYEDDARANNLNIILMASPLTSEERLKEISRISSGFLYYTTVKGTTGPRKALPKDLLENLANVRSISKLPVAAGFGISNRGQWEMLSGHCDAIVVGSALMQIVMQSKTKEVIGKVEDFVKNLTA